MQFIETRYLHLTQNINLYQNFPVMDKNVTQSINVMSEQHDCSSNV